MNVSTDIATYIVQDIILYAHTILEDVHSYLLFMYMLHVHIFE